MKAQLMFAVLAAGALCVSGCCPLERAGSIDAPLKVMDLAGAVRSRPPIYDPALPGYRLQVHGTSYGTVFLRPATGDLPEQLTLVFLGRVPPVSFCIQNESEHLSLRGDYTVLRAKPKVSPGDMTLISRDPLGVYLDVQQKQGEGRIVLKSKTMRLLRKPVSIGWGIPR